MLLNSKCYPLMNNDNMCYPDFWRSTRKILAASKSMYEKQGGESAETDWAKHMAGKMPEDAAGQNGPPTKKARVGKGKYKKVMVESCSTDKKLGAVVKRLDSIDRRLRIYLITCGRAMNVAFANLPARSLW